MLVFFVLCLRQLSMQQIWMPYLLQLKQVGQIKEMRRSGNNLLYNIHWYKLVVYIDSQGTIDGSVYLPFEVPFCLFFLDLQHIFP